MKRAGLALTLIMAFCVLLVVEVQSARPTPKTITVPDDYPTITAAVQNASDGDTIFVKSGNYTESVEIDKSISLVGEKQNTTVITAPVGTFNLRTPIVVFANYVKIHNLTIINNNFMGTGISISGNATQIFGNTITSPTSVYTRGPFTSISENYLSSGTACVHVVTSQCNITNNILSSHNYGVDLEGSSNLVCRNTINGLHEDYDFSSHGVFINDGNSNVISNNEIANANDGICVFNGSYNTITANSITNCTGIGLRIEEGLNNTFLDNNVTDSKFGTGMGSKADKNTIYHNNFVNNIEQVAIQPNVTDYWDNGKEGNYWSDFLTRYPGAKEIDKSGVWNTPYVITSRTQTISLLRCLM